MTEEMSKMVEVLVENEKLLGDALDGNKRYIAPNIPEKVFNKLLKHWGNTLPVNSVVAFYDSSVFKNCKAGLIFTNDGIYHGYDEKRYIM